MPSALGLAQVGLAAVAAGAGAGAGAAALLGAGVCDQARPDAHSETAPAKINPAAIRIFFIPYADPVPGRGFFAIVQALSCP